MFGSLTRPAGLDLGSSSVKALQLKGAGSRLRAVAAAVEPLPAGSIVDGAVVDPEAVAEAVRRACDRGPFARHVAVALPGSAAIVRRITIPPVAEPEREEAIRWEASRQIPFDIEDVHFDYQLLHTRADADEVGSVEVLLAAAKKETVAGYTAAVVRSGRMPVVVDLNPFACRNAYEANYESNLEESIALLDAGAAGVGVTVLQGGECVFTRDIPRGGRACSDVLQKELALTFEESERAKKGDLGSAPPEQVKTLLREVTEGILLEVSKTFSFLRTTTLPRDIDRIVVTGGMSRMADFHRMVRERFGKPVIELDPFRTVGWDVDVAWCPRAELTPVMAVALGLALRRPGDGTEGRR